MSISRKIAFPAIAAFAILIGGFAVAHAKDATSRILTQADRAETAAKVVQVAYEIQKALGTVKIIQRACRHADVRLKQLGVDYYAADDIHHPQTRLAQHVENCCRTHLDGEVAGIGGTLLEAFVNPLPKFSKNKRAAALAKAEKLTETLIGSHMDAIYREIAATQAASRQGFALACTPVIAFDLLAP
jgi:hypothetical protein